MEVSKSLYAFSFCFSTEKDNEISSQYYIKHIRWVTAIIAERLGKVPLQNKWESVLRGEIHD